MGQNYNINMDNIVFERFIYFGTTQTNQNSVHEEIKSRLKSGSAFYHSMQNLSSYSLLSKNVNIKMFACCFVWL
jgi:hypothetical protein